MTKHSVRAIVLVATLVFALAGAYAQTARPAATTQSSADRASLALAEIEPGLALPEPRAITEIELPAQARELLARAEKFLAARSGVMAIMELEKALSYAPRSRRIHLALGRTHIATGNVAKAELHLTRALGFGSDDQETWYLLAVTQRELKRELAALRSLLLANLASPAPADSSVAVLLPYELGSVLDAQGYSAAALPLLEKAQALLNSGELSRQQQDDSRIAGLRRTGAAALSANIARLKVASGDSASAITELEKLVATGKAERAIHIALVQAYLKQNAGAKARQAMTTLATSVSPGDADGLVDDLNRAFGNAAPVASLLKESLPSPPRSADSTLALAAAIAQARIDKVAEAARICRELIDSAPDCPAVVYVRCVQLQDNPAARLTLWRDGLAAHPRDPAIMAAGDGLFELDSAAAGRLSASLAGNDVASLYVRGRLLVAASQPDEAMKHFEKASEQKPDFAPAYVQRMKLHAAAGEHDKVLAVREQAGKASVKSAAIHHLAGLALMRRAGTAPELLAKALDELRLAEQLDRDNVHIVLDLADAYLADGQTASGLRRLRRLFERDPRNVAVLLRLARANEEMGQFQEALGYAEAAQKIDPRNTEANRIRGMSLLAEGRSREAIPILQIVARENPNDARSHAALGQALVAGARWAEAVKPLQKALALDATLLAARRALADAFAKTARLDEAVEQWRLLVDRLPDDVEVAGNLMAELIRRDHLEEAAELLEKLTAGRDLFADQLIRRAIAARKFDLAMKVINRQVELAGEAEDERRVWQVRKVQLLVAQGKRGEAVVAAEQYHKKFPDDQQFVSVYVAALLMTKRTDDAVKVAKAAYERDPAGSAAWIYFDTLITVRKFEPAIELTEKNGANLENPELAQRWRMSRVRALQGAQRKADAIKAAAQLYDESPDSQSVTMLYVRTLLWAKDYDRALAVLDKAVRDRIDPDTLTELRMRTLAGLGRFDDLDKELEKLLARFDDVELQSEAWYIAGAIYSIVGQIERCHKALEQALKLNPLNASANNDLGYHLADAGKDLDRAEKLIKVAVQQHPDESAYLDSLAWVFYKKGQFEESAEILARVVEQELDHDSVILDHYGDVLWRLGKRQEAIAQWRAAAAAAAANTDRPAGVEQSTPEKIKSKLKAIEDGDGDPPVAPLGDGVVPPGAART